MKLWSLYRFAGIVCILGLLLTALPASAEIYRWVDEQGQVHYGDRPAPGADSLVIEGPALLGNDPPAAEPDQEREGNALSAGDLASCLRRQGVKYYSASWCPQCARQEKMFGRSGRSLPRVECAIDGGRGSRPIPPGFSRTALAAPG